MEQGTPASWQPDPTGRHEHRYWDGEAWTDSVSDAGSTAVDAYDVAQSPAPAAAPEPSPAPAPAAAPTAASVPTPSPVPAPSPAVERLGPNAKAHTAVGGGFVPTIVVAVLALVAVIEVLSLLFS